MGAAQSLKAVLLDFDWEKIENYSIENGITWKLSPADSPWWNSCCEALIRSVKKVIRNAIDQTNLTFSEFQTVLFQCSTLLNERPIGVNKSSEHDFTYLCPNDVLLGRSSSKVPVDNFSDQNPLSRRIAFIESSGCSFS